jgi:hypothetical protein
MFCLRRFILIVASDGILLTKHQHSTELFQNQVFNHPKTGSETAYKNMAISGYTADVSSVGVETLVGVEMLAGVEMHSFNIHILLLIGNVIGLQ